MTDPWFKHTVIYALDVETYADGNGDGIGDFCGLRQKLDYLSELGAGTLWLTPFYETPNRDNGYDITNHCAVDPRLGTLDDFDAFCQDAHDRGFRVLIDLVVNHTSDEHPWFMSSRIDPASPVRPFYRWSADPAPPEEATVFRNPAERSVWTYDEVAGLYYRHQFLPFQPDLATGDPEVRRAIGEIMAFWLDRGVDGFRVDAARHLGGRTDGSRYEATDPHQVLKLMRRFAQTRQPETILIGESDAPPENLADFFGDGDELQMIQNFLLDNFVMLALAREQAEPIGRVLATLPQPPPNAQWANFLRNFDELDLERLTVEERNEVYAAFAPEPEMRIYGRGIRRRLAPMLGGDRRRIALAQSLLLTLPGSPILLYGDEIGMGDDLSLPDRKGVRTPMQWSKRPNAGFSTAPRKKLPLPPIDTGPFSYERVNVEAAACDPDSLLTLLKRGIAVRNRHPTFGATLDGPVKVDNPAVLVHRLADANGTILAVHNLGREPCKAVLDLDDAVVSRLTAIHGNRNYDDWNLPADRITLDSYGFRWFWGAPPDSVASMATGEATGVDGAVSPEIGDATDSQREARLKQSN